MRARLLWKPGLLCERLAYRLRQRRRLKKLSRTVARDLAVGHIESLELLEIAKAREIHVIYDIGANVGTWSLLAKALIPEAIIEAFEPLREHHTSFSARLRKVSGVTLHRIALGAENTIALLRVNNFTDASSFLPVAEAGRSEFGLAEIEQASVDLRRLDDYRTELELLFPDLIKLDVQGFELEVLKGAEECLRKVKAVVVEVSFADYYERQCLFHEIVGFLARFDLSLAMVGEHTPTAALLRQMDALFLKPSQ